MKFAKYYALITQFVIETLVLVFLGLYIGSKLDPDGVLNGILATVGGLLGIVFFVIYVIKVGEKDGRTKKGDSEGGNPEA